MDPLPEFLNLFVNVTLHEDGKVTCRPNQLNIPGNAIATITWVPTKDNFMFKDFKWCQSNGFLTQTPIIHDLCVISAVHNMKLENQGIFLYQLTVTANGVDHATPACPGPGEGNGQPKIHNQ